MAESNKASETVKQDADNHINSNEGKKADKEKSAVKEINKNDSSKGAAKKNTPKKGAPKKNTSKNTKKKKLSNEIKGIIMIAAAILLLIMLFGSNSMGIAGKAYNLLIMQLFGFGSVALPLALGYYGWLTISSKDMKFLRFKLIVLACMIFSICSMIHAVRDKTDLSTINFFVYLYKCYLNGNILNGGLFGGLFGGIMIKLFSNRFVVFFIYVVSCLVWAIMLTGKSFVDVVVKIKNFVMGISAEANEALEYNAPNDKKQTARATEKKAENKKAREGINDRSNTDSQTERISVFAKIKSFFADNNDYDDYDETVEVKEVNSAEDTEAEKATEKAVQEEKVVKKKVSFADKNNVRQKRRALKNIELEADKELAAIKSGEKEKTEEDTETEEEQTKRLEALSNVNKREKEYQDKVKSLGVPNFYINDDDVEYEDDDEPLIFETDFINKNNKIYNPNIPKEKADIPDFRETLKKEMDKINRKRSEPQEKITDLMDDIIPQPRKVKTDIKREDSASNDADRGAANYEEQMPYNEEALQPEYNGDEYTAPKADEIQPESQAQEQDNEESNSPYTAYVMNEMGVYVRTTRKNSQNKDFTAYGMGDFGSSTVRKGAESSENYTQSQENNEQASAAEVYGKENRSIDEKADIKPVVSQNKYSSTPVEKTEKPVYQGSAVARHRYEPPKPADNLTNINQTAAQKPLFRNEVRPIAYGDNSPVPSREDAPLIIEAEKEKIVDKLNVEEKKHIFEKKYEFPKIEFLSVNPKVHSMGPRDEMILKAKKLENTLSTFGINAKVNNISQGPAVTRYEITPPQGVRVNKIVSLDDDIMLSLAAKSVRIEAPIPGKSAIGIEIPNDEVSSVYFSEILKTKKFQDIESKIAFGIGKDITGNVIIADIAKMPHLLIAGATGSGKSVCINTLITSILYKASPSEVRFIMVDPKVVELSAYNDIPHLLIPVVTDVHKAAGALKWATVEMDRRYMLFAQTGTKNLSGYNKFVSEHGGNTLPQIVIIIDELADLMLSAKKEVEAYIQRLTQLARAAGMHLIVATQRPSVDVITGVIKSNIPSRIAFKVASAVDSKTILDSGGAEKLLGNGDMIMKVAGVKGLDPNMPLRVQGAFVADSDVERIVDFIKVEDGNYDEDVIRDIETNMVSDESESVQESSGSSDGSDELTDEVIEFLVKKGKASIGLVQRRFRIGYNRAARIIEELEERGIVGPENGTKGRAVYMDKEELFDRKNRYEDM